MLKATNTTTSTVAANGTIPITLVSNTNSKTSLKNNTIYLNDPGHYMINATMNVTANTTSANVGLYANGTLIPETNVTIDTTAAGEYQLVISDLETVVRTTPLSDKVALTFQSVSGMVVDVINVSVYALR